MGEELKERDCIDVWKWWIYMALDIITEISYGASVNILENFYLGVSPSALVSAYPKMLNF